MHTRTLALALILSLGSASAHDLYLMPDRFHVVAGETLPIAVHNGDAFPNSEVSASVERLRDAALSSSKTSQAVTDLRIESNRTVGSVQVPGPGTLLLTIRTVPNFIELAPDKFQEYLKEEGLEHVIDWRAKNGEASKPGRERYSKYAKSLLSTGTSSEQFRHAAGFPIEIIPEKDPYALKAGDALPVQVLFRGAPAADLQLEAAWSGPGGTTVKIIGQTDAKGRISVPLASAGKWRLHSLKMERCQEPAAADWESFWASLTFEIR